MGEEKRPKPGSVNMAAQRGGFAKEVEKAALKTPEPWKYDLRKKWLHGFAAAHIKEPVPQNRQKMAFKWLATPAEQQEIEKFDRTRPAKPDLTAKKYTYIDNIILQNSKEEYPKPGPGNYFLDSKSARQLYKDNTDLVLPKAAGQDDSQGQKDKLP